jgi:hypothetical protein
MAALPTVKRIALGFAVAPVLLPIAWLGLSLALDGLPDPEEASRLSLCLVDLGITTAVAYAVVVPLGAPIVLLLRLAGRATVPWIVATAAVVGSAASCVASSTMFRGRGLERSVVLAAGAALGFVFAALVAAVFCAVAGVPLRRRSGQPDAPPPVQPASS